MRRVAITGMGVVSPIGNDIETFRKNLLDGICGIDYITRFNADDFKVKIAAEVKDFQVTDYVDKSEARRMDLFTQYAVVAAKEAVEQSGIIRKGGAGEVWRLCRLRNRRYGYSCKHYVKIHERGFEKGLSFVHSHDDF